MTPQEMFDKAYKGVIAQECKSGTSINGCKYRGPNNTACGIGHLVDDATARAWDRRAHSGITNIMSSKSAQKYPAPDFMKANFAFCRDLQKAHDRCFHQESEKFIEEFKRNMEKVANEYDLTIPEIA